MTEQELTELDLAVAQAEGVDATLSDATASGHRDCIVHFGRFPGTGVLMGRIFSPSRHWSDAGPLLLKHRLELSTEPNDEWSASKIVREKFDGGETEHLLCSEFGQTPLIAICMATVALKRVAP